MKRVALHFGAAMLCFAIGVCISVLCSALSSSSSEIDPVVIRNEPETKLVLVNSELAPPSKMCKANLVYAKGQIRSIDFCNFRFPGFYDDQIVLRDGQQEIKRPCGGTVYSLQYVYLVDLTSDGRDEAVVCVEDFSGCGSSGVSYNYYVYTMRFGRPFLLWRVATGSEGLAGLKDFKVQGRELVFEVFGHSRIVGENIIGGDPGGECCPESFSRISVAWTGKRFRQVDVKVFSVSQGRYASRVAGGCEACR